MKVELIDHMGTDLSAVNAARVSMNKESDWIWDKIDLGNGVEQVGPGFKLADKDAKLIAYLAKNKHDSCFEHQVVTLRLKVPLFICAQIQRHRTFAYNQISRRYVKEDLEFYWPETWRKAADNIKQGSSDIAADLSFVTRDTLDDFKRECDLLYAYMLEDGVCAEQARMLLPQNLYTQFYMTGNLRNFCHFLKLRLHEHAQKEIRDVAKMMVDIIEPLFPVSTKTLISV